MYWEEGADHILRRKNKTMQLIKLHKSVHDPQYLWAPLTSTSWEAEDYLSQPQCSFGEFVLFNILFNVFVHLGHDSLLLWVLFLAVALSWIFPRIRCSTMYLRGQCLPWGWKTDHIVLWFVNCKRCGKNVFHLPWNLLRLWHHATESIWRNANCFKYFIRYNSETPRGRWGLTTYLFLSNTRTSDSWPPP